MAMAVELFGYLGSVLVVVSMLMTSVVKLRVINMVGNIVSGVYSLIVGALPLALMNWSLLVINIYSLYKLLKTKQKYDMVEGKADDTFLLCILERYREDIKNYFQDFAWKKNNFDVAYIVFCEDTPAGILLGKMQKDGTLEVALDYSTPAYRDCSVGEYLYSNLPAKGIKKVTFSGKSQNHDGYLKKMGFVEENGVYVKKL